MDSMKIQTPNGERQIGPGYPTFIIAEMSGNHNHDYKRAEAIVDAAAEAGADALKMQTYTADSLTIDCKKEHFQVKVNDAWSGQTLYSLYEQAHTPWDWQPKLKRYAESKGLTVFSSPFDEKAVDFLEKMDVQLYKVASFESGDLELLKKIGSTGKPVIMSRGMTSIEALDLAIKTLKEAGAPQVAVLHCISSYPATPEQMNLSTIADVKERFDVVSGLSDHTLGITMPIMSIALGASIVEKHFTLKREDGGPDSSFSLEPEELKELVKDIREAEKAIGVPTYSVGEKESENLVFRRSIFVIKDMKKGEELTRENVRVIRPGYGMEPKYLSDVLGKRVKKDMERGDPLMIEDVEGLSVE